MDACDETLLDAPPEEAERRSRDEPGTCLSELPDEIRYHAATRPLRAPHLAQRKDPGLGALHHGPPGCSDQGPD